MIEKSAEFRTAVREFNSGRYFEAHEIWETLWLEETGETRRQLEGLVRMSVGFHKAEIGIPGGARKLWTSALRSLEGAPADALGIDVVGLRAAIRAALDAPPAGPWRAPRIEGVP